MSAIPLSGPVIAAQTSHLSVRYDRDLALDDVSLRFPSSTLSAIVGPNGAGKSTLIKALLGLVPVEAGTVELLGAPYRRGDQRIVYVPQRRAIDWDFPVTVRDVIRQGRYGHLGLLGRFQSKDRDAVEEAIERTGVGKVLDRQIGELSGGQQQRVFFARALAQRGDLLFLDEPFAGVDATTESDLLTLLRELCAEGKTAIVVHHDLGTVRRSFSYIALLNTSVQAEGPTEQVFSEENLAATYGDRLAVIDDVALAPR